MTFLFCSGSFILLLCVINCRKTFILNCAKMNYRPQQNSAHRWWSETHRELTLSALTCQISVGRRFDELSNQACAYMICIVFNFFCCLFQEMQWWFCQWPCPSSCGDPDWRPAVIRACRQWMTSRHGGNTPTTFSSVHARKNCSPSPSVWPNLPQLGTVHHFYF